MDSLMVQTFDFSNQTIEEKVASWIAAIAKIPLINMKCSTFPATIAFLVKTLGLKKSFNTTPKQNNLFCAEVSPNLTVNWDVYADMQEGWYGDGKDLFCITHDFTGHDELMSEMRIFFLKDGRADIAFDTSHSIMEREVEFKKLHNIKDGYITWQEAYDVLCLIARTKHEALPVAPTV